MRLNVGCGVYPDRGAVNLDVVPLPGVDVVWDVDDEPWPFTDELFDEIDAVQVFEHLNKPLTFMRQAHRVLKEFGRLVIVVPHYQSENAFTDPTHKRFCTPRTWDYWIVGTALNEQFGASYAQQAVFQRESIDVVGEDIRVVLRKRSSPT